MPRKIQKCSKHPKYKAVRFPTVDCVNCETQFRNTEWEENEIINKQLKLLKKMNMSHLSPAKFADAQGLEKLAGLELQRRELFK